MTIDVLGRRALNRATMARQLLLERADLAPVDAVAHLVGMQAQVPLNPYLGLWSRLRDFRPEELGRALEDREVVRIVAMRATIHLLTADDCLLLRPLCQPVLDGELARHPAMAPVLRGVDLRPVLAFASDVLAQRPRTGPQLRAALAERFPELDATALAYACRNHLALVQVPPRGVWGRRGQVTTTTAESWLGRPLVANPSVDDVVVRYLRAFGPATAADIAAWSRLTGFREVIDRLRPRLRAFRDERGRELVDVPDAPLPDPDTPAPVRFLPEYDNVALSHADRRRYTPGPADRRQRAGARLGAARRVPVRDVVDRAQRGRGDHDRAPWATAEGRRRRGRRRRRARPGLPGTVGGGARGAPRRDLTVGGGSAAAGEVLEHGPDHRGAVVGALQLQRSTRSNSGRSPIWRGERFSAPENSPIARRGRASSAPDGRDQLAPAAQPATPTMRSTSTRAKGWSRYCG